MRLALAIVGYGKMGHLIEQLAPEYGLDVRATFNSRNNIGGDGLTPEGLRGIDVAVEFSTPDSAPENIVRLTAAGVNSAVGTTGWLDRLPSIHEATARTGTGVVWAPNFSIGVNIFSQVVKHAATLLAAHRDFEAWGWEIHHAAKKDKLSGTLRQLAETMCNSGFGPPINLSSSRVGSHPGTHEIGFDSPTETITLRHTARSREGFARGALRAAQWIVNKKGVFEFKHIINELIEHTHECHRHSED
jgi:4-hydroxy-tetrahydrodipicolinate reductase